MQYETPHTLLKSSKRFCTAYDNNRTSYLIEMSIVKSINFTDQKCNQITEMQSDQIISRLHSDYN